MTSSDVHHRERPRFRDTALASGLVDEAQLTAAEALVGTPPLPDPAAGTAACEAWDQAVADRLVRDKVLTKFQARELLVGRRRFRLGQYTVLDEVARGGMGQVFRAEHAMMGREVAVKVLPRAKSTPESEAAFRREMRMLGRLDHENLVRAFDAGYDAMVYYLVTEYVPGLDLKRQVLKHGPLDEAQAASVISQAARGLAYAHDQGLVHRDVKPGNILVTPDGRVKVLDLGLAGSQIEEESSRLGRVVGTMDYIAPEQIRTPDDVGPSADIYALGCTLYFAVTGQVPFPGGTRREKMQRHLADTPIPVGQLAPRVSAGFCRVIEAMMAKDPAQRLQSAAEVIERLRRWTPSTPIPMPRRQKASRAADSESSSDLSSIPEEGVRGSRPSWPAEAGDAGGSSNPVFPLAGFDTDESDAAFELPATPYEDSSLRMLRMVGRSLTRAIIGGILVGLAAAALRELAPEQFAWRMSSAAIGWIACIVLFVAQVAAAGRTAR